MLSLIKNLKNKGEIMSLTSDLSTKIPTRPKMSYQEMGRKRSPTIRKMVGIVYLHQSRCLSTSI